MARHREDLGERKHVRIDLHKPGFLIPAPEAAWIECQILDVSDQGACLEVGALAVPKIFGLAFTADGGVFRVCWLVWRGGELIGARFVSAKELRQGLAFADADLGGSRGSRLLRRPAKPAARIIAAVVVARAVCRSID